MTSNEQFEKWFADLHAAGMTGTFVSDVSDYYNGAKAAWHIAYHARDAEIAALREQCRVLKEVLEAQDHHDAAAFQWAANNPQPDNATLRAWLLERAPISTALDEQRQAALALCRNNPGKDLPPLNPDHIERP